MSSGEGESSKRDTSSSTKKTPRKTKFRTWEAAPPHKPRLVSPDSGSEGGGDGSDDGDKGAPPPPPKPKPKPKPPDGGDGD